MDPDQLKKQAWNNAVHAAGTGHIFQRRYQKYRGRIIFRDWFFLALPVALLLTYTSDLLSLNEWKPLIQLSLAVCGTIQAFIAIWSLTARWDNELSYSERAMRDCNELKEGWKRLGNGQFRNLDVEFEALRERQSIQDSHDIMKAVTHAEKKAGMRAGLIEFQKACVCQQVPTGPTPPLWVKRKCSVCGGN